ncbi:Syntaxin-31 [Bienertia sinuspersici]
MASVGITSFRDRTAEFRSLSETLKKIGGISAVDFTVNQSSPIVQSREQTSSSSSRSEFNKKASRIGLGIHEANRKIARLSQTAKKSSMFNDPTVEIQELTALIKDDIKALNVAFADLQNLQNIELAKSYSDDKATHANAICDDIKNRLMAATKQFQEVLTARTQNIKAHETRKQLFSANASRDNPFQHHVKPVTEPPPWLNSSNVSASAQPTGPASTPSSGVQAGSQLRRRLGTESTDNVPSNNIEMSMLQQVAPQQESHARNRATALQNVESTISELSGIFTHLATVVAQQGELAIRIDDNMEESLSNVDGAHSALLKHLTRISSNRSLLIKLFAVLILFIVVFVFFIV